MRARSALVALGLIGSTLSIAPPAATAMPAAPTVPSPTASANLNLNVDDQVIATNVEMVTVLLAVAHDIETTDALFNGGEVASDTKQQVVANRARRELATKGLHPRFESQMAFDNVLGRPALVALKTMRPGVSENRYRLVLNQIRDKSLGQGSAEDAVRRVLNRHNMFGGGATVTRAMKTFRGQGFIWELLCPARDCSGLGQGTYFVKNPGRNGVSERFWKDQAFASTARDAKGLRQQQTISKAKTEASRTRKAAEHRAQLAATTTGAARQENIRKAISAANQAEYWANRAASLEGLSGLKISLSEEKKAIALEKDAMVRLRPHTRWRQGSETPFVGLNGWRVSQVANPVGTGDIPYRMRRSVENISNRSVYVPNRRGAESRSIRVVKGQIAPAPGDAAGYIGSVLERKTSQLLKAHSAVGFRSDPMKGGFSPGLKIAFGIISIAQVLIDFATTPGDIAEFVDTTNSALDDAGYGNRLSDAQAVGNSGSSVDQTQQAIAMDGVREAKGLHNDIFGDGRTPTQKEIDDYLEAVDKIAADTNRAIARAGLADSQLANAVAEGRASDRQAAEFLGNTELEVELAIEEADAARAAADSTSGLGSGTSTGGSSTSSGSSSGGSSSSSSSSGGSGNSGGSDGGQSDAGQLDGGMIGESEGSSSGGSTGGNPHR